MRPYEKKGRILRPCALILCLAALIAMSGCDPLSRWAPPEISEKWVSNDPEMVLHFEQDGQQNCWILWNGTRTEVEVGFRAGFFWVTLAGPRVPTVTLLQGSWRYKGDKLLFLIEEDDFFDGAYKTLVFTNAGAEG